MRSRWVVLGLGLMLPALAACQPTPQPTITPTETLPSVTQSVEPSESPSQDHEAIDEYNGVATEDFLTLPNNLVDLFKAHEEANVEEHRAVVEYSGQGGDIKLGVAAYFVEIKPGEFAPITSAGDERYQQALEDASATLESEGREVEARVVTAGGIQWNCVLGLGDEDLGRDVEVCRAVLHGRIVSASFMVVHDDDGNALATVTENYLGHLGEALVTVGRS